MQTQPAMKPAEPIGGLWWLVPFFLAWIGGLIAYFVLKDRNDFAQSPDVLQPVYA